MSASEELTMLIPPAEWTDLRVEWCAAEALPPEAAAYIEGRWEHYLAEAQAAGKSLFNGPVTQLLAWLWMPVADGVRVELHLGPAEYRDFLVTRLRDRAWFAAHAPQSTVEALGNSALVTRGDRALLGRRSPRVSCYAGRLHLIGGVLEALDTPAFPASRAGLEAHLWMELSEEIGLVRGEECAGGGGWPRVLGLARDEFLGQPELFWQWEVAVELEALLARLDQTEHTEAVILRRDEMTEEVWRQCTPVAREAWRLWAGA